MSDSQISQNQTVSEELLNAALDVDFTEQLDKTFSADGSVLGKVARGIVLSLDKDTAIVDIGMKTEGRISLHEFKDSETGEITIKAGDSVDVFVDNMDNRRGEAVLSREKAKREEVLDSLEKAFADGEKVNGIIFGRVKGGFMVDVSGILGFLPGSQLDARPVTDPTPYMHTTLDFQLVKLDRARNNIIVSRRTGMDEESVANREELLADMHEGKKVKGIIKNITDYGAFVDLGGLDGLLHITDMAWHRIGHPSEILTLGQSIDLMVVRYDAKNQRVSLGLKQLNDDPWKNVEAGFAIGNRTKGKITNITDYGAFVELAPGVEGLIHVSEMSWTRKNVHPGKVVSTSEEVEVEVLEIDRDKRRISLGLKQCQDNPWSTFSSGFKVGDIVEGSIRSLTDFGVFLGLNDDIDGLIHVSDLAWEGTGEAELRQYKKGDTVKARILAIDPEKERVALGVKQLDGDPFTVVADTYKRGQVVNVTVTDTDSDGITVSLDGVEAYIRSRDLGVERSEQNTDRFKEGDVIEAKITTLSTRDRKLNISLRALQQDEEKEAVKAYASQEDSGNSAFADALAQAGVKTDAKAEKKTAAKKPAAKKAAKADDADDDATATSGQFFDLKKTDKFELYEDKKGEYRWKVAASNGENIAASTEGYKKEADAQANFDRDRSGDSVELYTDKAGEFRWRAKASNGNIVAATTEGYSAKRSATANIKRHGYTTAQTTELKDEA